MWKAQQQSGKSLTPEEKREDEEAIAAHEAAKRKFEDDVDGLVRDRPHPSKKQKRMQQNGQRKGGDVMMSGALGSTPSTEHSQKGANLIPTADPDAKAPWDGEGPPAVKIRMTVTSGFYVRSLCHDLGTKVGSAAMMAELCRSRQGDFEVGGANCLEYEDITKGEEVWAPKVKAMLESWSGKKASPEDTPVAAAPTPAKSSTDEPESGAEVNGAKPAVAEEETVLPSAEADSSPNGEEPAVMQARDDDEESWKGFQD